MNTPSKAQENENILVLIQDPKMAFLVSEIREIISGLDFNLCISIDQFKGDPIQPTYKIDIPDLNGMSFGPYHSEVDLLENMRVWFKYNPIQWETPPEDLGVDGTLPPDTIPEDVTPIDEETPEGAEVPEDEVDKVNEAKEEGANDDTDF
jgi:hypothetical protein